MSLDVFSEAGGTGKGVPRSGTTWQLALLFALAALFSGILLTGVSVWFLGAVALAGVGPAAFAFNFHVPAALVRLFAMTRTGAKYGERVFGHKAALIDQVSRRAGLFSAMAAAKGVRSAGWQLGDQDRLSDFIDDVDDVDYARLRVGLPMKTLAAGLGVLAVATLVIAPFSLAPIGLVLAINLAVAWWLLPRASNDWQSIRSMRRAAARRFGVTLAALVPLQAERALPPMLDAVFSRLSTAEKDRLRARRDQAILDATISLFGPLAALSVFATAWIGGERGEALLPAAFLAFSWLAFGDGMQGASRIVLARVRENAARKSVEQWTAGAGAAADAKPSSEKGPGVLELVRVPLSAPDGRRIGPEIDLVLRTGQPVMLAGPSGCGKTSLLKQVAGWLETDGDGQFLGDGVGLDAATRRRIVHLGLHDAAILSDTIRENLFAPDATDKECRDALKAVELDERVQAAGGVDAWIDQDMLSLGEAQRLNLARALLSHMPVVLLDEPTEHLDAEQAGRIMDRLVARFSGRILLFSSHEGKDFGEEREIPVVELS